VSDSAPGATQPTVGQVTLVGRDDAWVLDPLHEDRSAVGEKHARDIDDGATLLGEKYVDLSDDELAQIAGQGSPLEHLDGYLAWETLNTDHQWEHLQAIRRGAEEKLIVLESLAAERGADPDLQSEIDGQRERVESLQEESRDFFHDLEGWPVEYLHDWIDEHREGLQQHIAATREQEIRRRELELRAQDVTPEGISDAAVLDAGAQGPALPRRVIGRGEVADVLERRRAAEHQRRELAGEPGAAPHITRGDVWTPAALDDLRPVLGDERTNALARQAAPLAEWLRRQPEDWVHARHAALGEPGKGLDRAAALAVLRIDAARHAVTQELEDIVRQRTGQTVDLAGLTEAQLAELPGLTRHERDHASRRRADLDRREQHLRIEGHHPATWVVDHADHTILAAAYKDAHESFRHRNIAQEAEREVVDPTKYIIDRIGPAPEPPGLHSDWAHAARHLTYERRASDAELDRWGREPKVREVLDALVDRVRAQQGMQPLVREPAVRAAVEPPGLGR